jgi:signal recognition particle subunit SRP54
MFDSLSTKLEAAFNKIRGRGVLNQQDIETAMKAVRMALLEADVNYKVAKQFCEDVGQAALGEEILKSLTPDQQVIKLVHENLIKIMGNSASELNLKGSAPIVILMVGLQGSGKTTSSAKLALYLKKELKRNPYLVPVDVYRPAAIEQLKILGESIKVTVHPTDPNENPVVTAIAAKKRAELLGHDTIIVDTAGRLQIDQEMMEELKAISKELNPNETLLVVDAMTGQEAVNVATGFNEAIGLNGIVLTKLDGDARGGAALSMQAVTGKPIKFIGVGEKTSALEVFHPERMASRILGMGDVLSLIEKASKEIDIDETLALQKKIGKNNFDLDDFLSQLRMMKRMGSMSSIMGMIPGLNKMAKQVDPEAAEKQLKKIEAIILSMTPKERRNSAIIDGSRRKRIAKGSGTTVQDVNQLLKQFVEMKNMMKKLMGGGLGNLTKMFGGGMPNLGNFIRK